MTSAAGAVENRVEAMRVAPLYALASALWVGLYYTGSDGTAASAARTALTMLVPIWAALEIAARRLALTRAQCDEAFSPLGWLPLAAVARLLPLGFFPLLLAVTVTAAIATRLTTLLRPTVADRAERYALVGLLLPGVVLFQTTVVHDAFQYQATAVSMMLGGDYDLFNELFFFNSHRSYNPYAEGSIRYLGVVLIEMPALLVGHLLARASQLYPANGFSQPYTLAVSLLSCVGGIGGVALTYRWLSSHVQRRFALAALAAVFWASALPFFVFLWHGWTHGYSVLLSALFLLAFDRARQVDALLDSGSRAPDGGHWRWLNFGLLGGLLALVWPMNGFIVSLPAFELLGRVLRRDRRAIALGACFAAGMTLGFVPQIAGWYGATGTLVSSTYAKVGDYFDWWHPAPLAMLFDPLRHGLFTWHPVMLIGFTGLFFVEDRTLRRGLLGWVISQLLVMSCWSVWWTGIGFGNRFFLNLIPATALGTAALLKRLWGERRSSGALSWRRRGILATAVVLIIVNLSLLGAYRTDAIAMGIHAPNYVQSPPASIGQLLRVLTLEAPATLATLVSDFWVNQNFFAARLRLADWRPASWWSSAVVALLLVGALVLSARAATRRYRSLNPASAGGGAIALLLVLTIWLAFGLRPGREENDFYRFDMREEILTPYERVTLVPRGYLRPVQRVDIISFLTYAGATRHGQAVARVKVTPEGRRPVAFLLRAGIDTVEVAWGRDRSQRRDAHDATAATPVHEWMTRAVSTHLYPARAYLTRLNLPQAMRVETVEIEMLPNAGDLVLRDVFLES